MHQLCCRAALTHLQENDEVAKNNGTNFSNQQVQYLRSLVSPTLCKLVGGGIRMMRDSSQPEQALIHLECRVPFGGRLNISNEL